MSRTKSIYCTVPSPETQTPASTATGLDRSGIEEPIKREAHGQVDWNQHSAIIVTCHSGQTLFSGVAEVFPFLGRKFAIHQSIFMLAVLELSQMHWRINDSDQAAAARTTERLAAEQRSFVA